MQFRAVEVSRYVDADADEYLNLRRILFRAIFERIAIRYHRDKLSTPWRYIIQHTPGNHQSDTAESTLDQG